MPNLPFAESAITSFLNSAFVSAFLSALAGAGLGAWGAHRIAESAAKKDRLLATLNQANAIMVLTHAIANNTLAAKKQHIAPLIQEFAADREIARQLNESHLKGERPPEDVPNLRANMIKITPLVLPVDALKEMVFRGQMPGKAIALVIMVDQAACELAHAMQIRWEQIERFRSSNLPLDVFVQHFYGLRRSDGNEDCMYADSLRAIGQYTDDLAFFSAELANEVMNFAAQVHAKLVRLRAAPPEASRVNFDEARASGLLPGREDYEDWLSAFQ